MVSQKQKKDEPLQGENTEESVEMTPKKKRKQWSFPTVSKCPRCGTTDTICRHTDSQNGWQYRQCQRAICRHKYTVRGTKV